MSIAFEKIPLPPGSCYRLLKWSDNVRDVEICLPHGKTQRLEGAGEEWHFHPEIELTLVTKGRGRRFVGDHVSTLEAPDLVLIGSNLPHFWSGLTGSAGLSLQFICDQKHPLWQVAEAEPLRAVQQIASRGAMLTGPAVEAIQQQMQRITSTNPTDGLIHFLKILSTLCEMPSQDVTPLSDRQFSLVDRDPHMQQIAKAVQYVQTNFQEHIKLDDLLELTEMSKPTFCRQFKRLTGRTLMALTNQIRIDYARQLLIETDQPITDIAFESGFTNLSHFNRQFKNICGCSPRAFREQQGNHRA